MTKRPQRSLPPLLRMVVRSTCCKLALDIQDVAVQFTSTVRSHYRFCTTRRKSSTNKHHVPVAASRLKTRFSVGCVPTSFREPYDRHETRKNVLDSFASSHTVAEKLFTATQGLLTLQALFISDLKALRCRRYVA